MLSSINLIILDSLTSLPITISIPDLIY